MIKFFVTQLSYKFNFFLFGNNKKKLNVVRERRQKFLIVRHVHTRIV